MVDSDCVQPAAATRTVALCERARCEHYDEVVALRWARSIVPKLAELEPYHGLSLASAPWFQADARVRLYVRGDWLDPEPLPKPCAALEFVVSDQALVAHLDAHGRPSTPRGCTRQLVLDSAVTSIDGACSERDTGNVRLLGDGLILSSVDASGVVYDGVPVSATPRCQWSIVQHSACPERACRTCRIDLELSGQSGGRHFVTSGPSRETSYEAANPTCGPCLPDMHEVLLPRLAAIMRDRKFLFSADDEFSLSFFRAKADCDAYVRHARACAE